MDNKDGKKPLAGVPEDEIGSALDDALDTGVSAEPKTVFAAPAAEALAAMALDQPGPTAVSPIPAAARAPLPSIAPVVPSIPAVAPLVAPVVAPAAASSPAPDASGPDGAGAAQWYLGIEDRQEGPFFVEQIREMLSAGMATRDTLAWKDGLPDWLELSRIAELATLFQKPPAAAPQPPPPPPMTVVAAGPPPSLSSLVQGELDVLNRAHPEPVAAAAKPAPPVLEELTAPPEEPEAPAEEQAPSTYEPPAPVLRPAATHAVPWTQPAPSKWLYYALLVGGIVIAGLAGVVVVLLLRPAATPQPVQNPIAISDAGMAAAQRPAVDAGLAAPAVDAGTALAGSNEPPLPAEELAKLPENLTPQDIMKVVIADRESLAQCGDSQHEAEPGSSGKLVMRWTITVPYGKTSNIEVVTKKLEQSVIADCVERRIKTWEFPRHRKLGPPVEFPFKF